MSTTLASTPPLASAGAYVKQSRVIRASRQAVYDAWTKPEIFTKWWGPADHIVTDVVLDAREGGVLSFRDEALPHAPVPPGFPRSMTGSGVFTEVVPGERLQFTMKASWNAGEASLITVSFSDVEGGTEIVVKQEKISADHVHLYNAGWASTLNKLEELLLA